MPLLMLIQQQIKLEWTSVHHTAFFHLKVEITQAPVLRYPDPNKNTLSTQIHLMMHAEHSSHRKHDGTEFPIAFLLHTFTETQRK